MIWLVGNKGMLGTQLAELLSKEGLDFVGTDRELSILDLEALSAFASGKSLSWILNCAAYTAVDKAEEEDGLCRALNVDGPANLAVLANAIGARILHVSTDYVFDGSGSRPYREDDPVSPLGVYGRSKAEGEAAVRATCPEYLILRTAWLYGAHGPNFVRTMLRLMRERESVGVVADQHGSPTWAADLAEAILAILRAPEPRYGTYHFTDGGETSWHEFALEIERLGLEYGILARPCRVVALTSAEYPATAPRPAYSVLSTERIRSDYGLAIPDWRASLDRFLEGEATRA
jgi:dTDP-4-dehydrorhamnose reductase